MSEPPSTAIVIDSTPYLPQDTIDRHGMGVVSLYVTLDGEQRRELDIGDYRDFYSRLAASSEGATTSQPSIGDFLEVWLPRLEAGRDVVSVHLSSNISGTYETAVAAREQLLSEGRGGERVYVFDANTAAGGTGLCALAGAAVAERGGGPDEVMSRLEEASADLEIQFAVETLEYMRRGGRIGAAQALLGTALKIKPILSFESEVVPVDKVRTWKRAVQYLRDFAARRAESGPQAWCVQHVAAPEAAASLADECREAFGCDPAFISELGPVLGAHSGPGMVGIGAMPASALG